MLYHMVVPAALHQDQTIYKSLLRPIGQLQEQFSIVVTDREGLRTARYEGEMLPRVPLRVKMPSNDR